MSPRERRLAVGAFGALAVAWLGLKAIPGLTRHALVERSERAARVRLLAETRAALAGLPAMESSARQLTAGVSAAAPQFLSGGTAAEALADLNGRLAALAMRRGLRLVGFEPRADTLGAGAARRVRAVIRLEADFQGLAAWLDDIGRLQLTVAPTGVVVRPEQPFAPRQEPERLGVEIEMIGWYLAPVEGS
jgi:hypothetical protein